jgi:leader peptidase (prepilin peptidase)/N-methyltransferase
MLYLTQIFVFIFGTIIGSFLNVVIFRTEKEEEIVKTPSHCPYCKTRLKWFELFPLFSYLSLRAKCRYCREKISAQYPMVEAAVGFGFVFLFDYLSGKFGVLSPRFLVEVFFLAAIYCFLLLIFVYDLKTKIIPDNFLLPAAFLSFFYLLQKDIFQNCLDISNSRVVLGVMAAAAASFFFWTLFYFSKGRWMGFGDVKLVMLLGFLLGPKAMAVALFIAFFLGSVVGVALVAFSRLKMKSQIPFGPFLVLGGILAFFYADRFIVDYYKLLNYLNVAWYYRIFL